MIKPFIIIPLYIYPLEQAWDPLLDAARQRPDLRFVTVINPQNGPGNASLPDANYVAALRQLSELPNLQPPGYIRLCYGNRTLDIIRGEIELYRGWNTVVRLGGIFFDESPSNPDYVQYMTALADYTRTTWQTDLDEPGQVIYNPGVVVNRAFFDDPDYIVVFEQSEEHWVDYFVEQGLPLIESQVRQKSAVIVHSCSAETDSMSLLAQIESSGFMGLLITDQLGGGYTQWPVGWGQLVEGVANS